MTVNVLPFFHIYAMNVTLGPSLYNGGKMVIMPKFEPKTFVEAIEKHKVRTLARQCFFFIRPTSYS